jgi:hypothetical protein
MKIINKKSVILTSISILIMSMSLTAHAKIYKWTDANGQTHYTAQPPTQKKLRVKAKNIEDKIKANAGKHRAPAQTKTTSSSNTQASDEDKTEEKLEGPNPQLVKYCDSQRNNLVQLKKNFRNVWIDAKGKKTTLNQEQRQEKVSMLADKIKKDCADVQPLKKVANKS